MPRALRFFLLYLISLTVGCLGTELLCKLLGMSYPFTFPLLPYLMHFQDIALYRDRYDYYHSRLFYDVSGIPTLYPAPATILYKLLFLTHHAGITFLVIVSLFIFAFTYWLVRELSERKLSRNAIFAFVTGTALCSYPFAFEFRQGNLEGLLWCLVCLSIFLFVRRHYLLAGICIGVLASMKLYPIALVGLLVARKRYRDTLVAIGAMLSTTLLGLWMACPDLAYSWKRTQEGIALFQRGYTLHLVALGFDHSLFALVKRTLASVCSHVGRPLTDWNEAALHAYLPIAALLGFYLCFVRVRELPLVNQVGCIIGSMILLPPTSFDYTLVHLYVPLALLAISAVEQRHTLQRGITAAFVCLAVLLAPESEFIRHYVQLGGQIKAVALVCFLLLVARFPFRSSFDETTSVTAVHER